MNYFHSPRITLWAILLFPFACWGQNGYNLQKPDESFILPDALHEISGITSIDPYRVACIQNDKGIVYIFNLAQKKITREFKFGSYGDYDGITKAGNSLFVLRSDGQLSEISRNPQKHVIFNYIQTKIPAINNEGIAYDFKENRLLIVCKCGYINLDSRQKSRPIFCLDLHSQYIKQLPAFSIYLPEIQHYMFTHHFRIPEQQKTDNSPQNLLFKPSDIAINPVSGLIYILSAEEKLLYRFSRKGKLISIEILDKKLFPDAEAICFLRNGSLLIANAGVNKGKPTLLLFRCKNNIRNNSPSNRLQ